MHDRSLLGPADITDEQLTTMVADRLGVDDIVLLSSHAEVAPYDLEALTTGGRYWVRGTARTAGSETTYAFFVKVVQSWGRSPLFQQVPEEHRESALAMVPWRCEPEIYRSDLATRLPDGLTAPKAHAVIDLDDDSAAVWLEPIDELRTPWDLDKFERAAYLLGRLAASQQVRPLSTIAGEHARKRLRQYADGRLAVQLLPALRSDELWAHPLIAQTFDTQLRSDLLAAADSLPGLLEELYAMPMGASHGDACTRNLLSTAADDQLVVIDFGFWGEAPLGFDLTQLLLAEVQMGERPAAELPALEDACLPAFVRGLRDEGSDAATETVRRAHALLALLFAGFPAIPFEHLGGPPTPEIIRVTHQRAASARFILDLVDATAPG
jgi:Phosphotransferase enzyme family